LKMGILTPVHANVMKIPVTGKQGKILVQTFLIGEYQRTISTANENVAVGVLLKADQ
jgi:hypothetical protein